MNNDKMREAFCKMIERAHREGQKSTTGREGTDHLWETSELCRNMDAMFVALTQQPESEPVAWVMAHEDGCIDWGEDCFSDRSVVGSIPLYRSPRPSAQVREIPSTLFDGFAVYSALSDKAKARTSADNVSDVLDAVVGILRDSAPSIAEKPEEKITDADLQEMLHFLADRHHRAVFFPADAHDMANMAAHLVLEVQEYRNKARTAPSIAEHLDLSQACKDVVAERHRQVNTEGWTPEHDDQHDQGQMARAAVCYADPLNEGRESMPAKWPWGEEFWKPKSSRRNLVRAAALLVAEIERMDRAAPLHSGEDHE